MNEYDENRIKALIKTLRKAKEQAEATRLYLRFTDDVDTMIQTSLALDCIELALAYLSKEDDGQACRVCGCTEHHPCEDGCYWVEADLCSRCAGRGETK